MGNTLSSAPIVLNLPADRNLMLVVRLTAAGVIAKAGVTIDRMDDIKMAVEEVCGCLMDQQNPPGRINLCFQVVDRRLEVRAEATDIPHAVGDIDADALEIMTCILQSLVDQVEFQVADGFIAAISLWTAL